MELDEFKSILQSKPEAPTGTASIAEMERAVGRKVLTATGRLKQSILLEFVLSALLVAACGWMGWHWPYLYVKGIAVLAVSYCLIFLYFLRMLYKKIVFYEHSSPAVMERLEQTIDILERFTRLYFQFNMLMLPIAFIIGGITGYLDISAQGNSIGFSWAKAVAFYIAFFVAWSAFMYFFSKWYIKKQYGNHLLQLKEQLKDIKNG